MVTSHHNTTNLSGDRLKVAEDAALTQEEKILSFFTEHAGSLYAPHQIQSKLFWDDINFRFSAPLTSVRRAMTNLANDGKLRKTGSMVNGAYGMKTHTWVLEVVR